MDAPFFGDPAELDRVAAVASSIRSCPHRRPSACHGIARCALGMGDGGRVTREQCEDCVSSSDRWRPGPSGIPDEAVRPSGGGLPSSPVLFDADDRPLPLSGSRAGREVALFCGGPSLATTDLSPFMSPWCDRAAVNNAGALVRPHWWFCVDDPGKFHHDIWADPNCWKFASRHHRQNATRVKSGGEFSPSGKVAAEHPNVGFFRRHGSFDHRSWIGETTLSWGCEKDRDCSLGIRGGRSVMLIALKVLLVLGYRRIHLLGCDWHMDPNGAQYGFAQEKDREACASNNTAYDRIGARLRALCPAIEAIGAEVVNATPCSLLHAFRRCSPAEAAESIREANGAPPDLSGWYTS